MTTMCQRQVYNYPLPDDFYGHPSSHPNYNRNPYLEVDTTSRSMYINPQELSIASPPLSPGFNDYPFPAMPNHVSFRPTLEAGHPMNNPHSGPRKRSAQTPLMQDANGRFEMKRSSAHRITHQQQQQQQFSYQPSPLPLPPFSPTSTIPAGTSAYPPTPPYSPNTISASPTDISQAILGNTFTNSLSPNSINSTSAKPKITFTQTPLERSSCMHPDCLDPATGRSMKTFSRRADLQRHHQTTHEETVLISCPKHNCHRKGDRGFSRMDHLMEHRRGYHHEDIPKRSSRSRSPKQK